MSDLQYPACIRELYESEILGEAVFLALVAVATKPRDRYHFGTLLQLETETKARLRPFLAGYDLSLDETMDLSVVELVVAGYQGMSWPEFAGANIDPVSGFLATFEAIVAVGPVDDQTVLQSMVTHEAAILRWATMERDGITDGSLDDVIAQLQYPLPVPAGV